MVERLGYALSQSALDARVLRGGGSRACQSTDWSLVDALVRVLANAATWGKRGYGGGARLPLPFAQAFDLVAEGGGFFELEGAGGG